MILSTPPREILIETIQPLLESLTGYPYENTPRVSTSAEPFVLQHYHPFLAVVQMSGSSLVAHDHGGGEEDSFRFDIYGQIRTFAGISARTWVNRLHHDVTATLRAATRFNGTLYQIGCFDLAFGFEDFGLADQYGDFLLPCTARLRYTLAEMDGR